MSASKEMLKTQVQCDIDYARLMFKYTKIDGFVTILKSVFKVEGDLELRPSATHDNLDIYLSGDDFFRFSKQYKNEDMPILYESFHGYLKHAKGLNNDLFMSMAGELPVGSAAVLVNQKIVTVDELYRQNPSLVRDMAAEKLVEIPRPMPVQKPALRMMSFDR